VNIEYKNYVLSHQSFLTSCKDKDSIVVYDPEKTKVWTLQEVLMRCGPLGESLTRQDKTAIVELDKARKENKYVFKNDKSDNRIYMVWIDPDNGNQINLAYAEKEQAATRKKIFYKTPEEAVELLAVWYQERLHERFHLVDPEFGPAGNSSLVVKDIRKSLEGVWLDTDWDYASRLLDKKTKGNLVAAAAVGHNVAWIDHIMKCRVYRITKVDGNKLTISYQDTRDETDANRVLAAVQKNTKGGPSVNVQITKDGNVQISNILSFTNGSPEPAILRPSAGKPALPQEQANTVGTKITLNPKRQTPDRKAKDAPGSRPSPEQGVLFKWGDAHSAYDQARSKTQPTTSAQRSPRNKDKSPKIKFDPEDGPSEASSPTEQFLEVPWDDICKSFNEASEQVTCRSNLGDRFMLAWVDGGNTHIYSAEGSIGSKADRCYQRYLGNPTAVKRKFESIRRDFLSEPGFYGSDLEIRNGRVEKCEKESKPVNEQASKPSEERSLNTRISTPRSTRSTYKSRVPYCEPPTQARSNPRDTNHKPSSTPGHDSRLEFTSRTKKKAVSTFTS
jgi:hypothetical protein